MKNFRMNRTPQTAGWLCLIAGILAMPFARAAAPVELKDGDRILFIGDSFFEYEVDHGHIETRLTAAFPDRNLTFRNLAWAAESSVIAAASRSRRSMSKAVSAA